MQRDHFQRANLLFWRALAGCLLALLASSAFAAAPAGSWWNASFPYRYKITIPAGSSDLDAGYAVSTTFNHAAAVTAATSLASGDDVRIVRWNGSAWVELDRISNAPQTWNTTSTRVWFKTAAAINSGASDDNYYLYYGKTVSPGTPPANGENVFTLHDEFTGTTLNTTRWTAGGSGTLSVGSGNLTLSPGRTLQSAATFGLDTIWEARALVSDTLPGGGSKFFWLWMASNSSSYNNDHLGFYADVSSFYTASRNSGATANGYTASTPTSFHIYSFTREFVLFIIVFPYSNFSIDGTLVDTITTGLFSYTVPTVALPVLVKNDANGSRTQTYDWMRVRPYRNPEPVPTAGSLEQLSLGLHHFVVEHDGYGINCAPETITVRPYDSSNALVTNYSQQITLTTNTGKGTWTKVSGTGTFTDATANDGLATYQWVSGETSASFSLFYPEGTQSFDVDAYQTSDTTLRDDDTEGNLSFSPVGFTLASTPITSSGTAGTAYDMTITAYGQTSSDPLCGVIKGYTGAKSLKFWTSYSNPATGTLRIAVNSVASAATEGTSVAQTVNFSNGIASSVSTKYKDVGRVTLAVKDDTTGNPSLPTGIRGSADMIFKPANFLLTQIKKTSDGVANPAASSATGTVFMTAGDSFSATVTVYDSEGSITPNYGKETTPHSVELVPTVALPSGGADGVISGNFGTFTNGVATGTNFSWSEVGIVTLSPHVAKISGTSSYLGAGDVTGTSSGNIGRFIPANFLVTANTPSLQTGCAAGDFSYMGKTLDYSTPTVLTVTARNTAGATTQNYAGAFNKLTASALTGRTSYTSTPGTLSAPAGQTASDPTLLVLGSGQTRLTYPTSLNVAFPHTTPVAPFTPQITLSLASFQDTDGVALSSAPYLLPSSGGIAFSSGTGRQYYGRLAFRNVVGSELMDLQVPFNVEFYKSTGEGFVTNTMDTGGSCTSGITMSFGTYAGSLVAGRTCVLDTGNPGLSTIGCAAAASDTSKRFTQSPSLGKFTLWLQAPGASYQGSVTLTPTVPSWLQYDWNTGSAGLESPTAIVTFGVYQGSPRRVYTRERY